MLVQLYIRTDFHYSREVCSLHKSVDISPY